MRVRKKPWAEKEIVNNPDIVIPNPEEMRGKWRDVLGNNRPIHLEIGTGKGQFITGMAKQNRAINYIGIEVQTSVVAMALLKLQQAREDHYLSNVCLLSADAQQVLDFFEQDEISRIYLNFSDPWPKSRHAKRRLTHSNFLEKYQYILKQQGEVHLKTDNEGLFEYSLSSFSDFGCRLQQISLNLHQSELEGNVMTEYEQKFSEKGQRVFRCEAVMPVQQ